MPEAMYMLGLMYEKGYGIQNDICMAIYWYIYKIIELSLSI